MDVLLPFGLVSANGHRYRNVRLGPLNGFGELESTEEGNPVRAVIGILRHSVEVLGPYHRREMTEGILGRLLPMDRDYLAVQLIRATQGDSIHLVVECPRQDCGSKLDLMPDLSGVEAEALPESMVIDLPLPDGRTVRLRLPTSADQLELYDGVEDRDRALLRACLVDDADTVDAAAIAALPHDALAELAANLLARSPRLDLTAELMCVECDRPFRFTFEPSTQLIRMLQSSKAQLMGEVHTLAFHYHWSLHDILELSRPRRKEFIELIDAELGGGGLG